MERIKSKQQAELHFDEEVDVSGPFQSDTEALLDQSELPSQRPLEDSPLGSHFSSPLSPPTEASTALQICREIWIHEGWVGFFRGYWLGVAVYVPHSMIYFTIYENVISLRVAFILEA